MSIPQIDEANRKKPLCYDPARNKFIYLDEIITGKERIILPSTLSLADQKKLIIKRQQKGPQDERSQSISGPVMRPADIIKSIVNGESYGNDFVEAEINYLDYFLKLMKEDLK